MSRRCFLSTSPLFFMPKRPVADDQNPRNDPHAKELLQNQSVYWNALVFFSARVLSHCGFILSLLAIWLAWLMPTGILEQPAAPDIKTLKSRTKPPRRPIPPHLPLDVQTNLAPIILPTNAADNQQPTRHVYFADAAPDATTVNQAMVSEPLPQTPDILQSNVPSQVTEASPQSSVLVPSENPGGPSESLDSLVLDSDSSSRPSSLKRPGFSKFKLFRSYSLDVNPTSITSDEVVSPLGIATQFLKGQRASLPPSRPVKPPPSRFPFRRCSVPVGQDKPPSQTSKPRTMPYGPPYFATPPILLDRHYSTSLSARPQFKDENLNSRAPESDCELSRGRMIRRVDLRSTAPKRHKPRSMSEDIASR